VNAVHGDTEEKHVKECDTPGGGSSEETTLEEERRCLSERPDDDGDECSGC
jgi:hypothetical protein